ncbi:MAG TPA: pantoate--beta-alanine ligase [Actinomycetota bacterium]|nr:pantoate--beta-alanine ligase [Actinomycetota bacterium]
MEVTPSAARLREATEHARREGHEVGFVPTMGALHAGHARLLETARRECGFVAASIFINPLQFGPAEDLAAYPRPIEQDEETARSLGVDLLFRPDEGELYPNGRPAVMVDPGPVGDRLEGESRPGHFAGVLTVVAKLFHLIGPARAYFGEKDAQQLALVRRMVRDLDMATTVVGIPTVRETDGLALSSRNAYLGPEERAVAPVLFEALSDVATLARSGERDADRLRAELARTIGAQPLAKLDYAAIVDDETWEDVRVITRPARALVAARIGPARLIDNLLLPGPADPNVQNRAEPEPED